MVSTTELMVLRPARRVIDTLRAGFPHLTWRWEHPRWVADDGSYVQACAVLSPRYDGDDDTFRTEYWRYYPDRSPERVWL